MYCWKNNAWGNDSQTGKYLLDLKCHKIYVNVIVKFPVIKGERKGKGYLQY